MLHIAPTEEFIRRTTRLASKSAGHALAIRCRESGLRARALARLANEMPDVIVVRSRNALDQAERAIFDVATALGEDVVQEIDGRLQEEPDEPSATLELLSERLDGRRLLVDGFDELLSSGLDRELGRTQECRRRSVYQWLSRKGRIFLIRGGGAPAHSIVDDEFDSRPDVELRNGARVSFDTYAEGRDHGLLLAAYLLGEEDVREVPLPREDLRSRIDQLLPDSTQRLLRTLALHDRPLTRDVALSLFGADSIELGLRLGLVHESSGSLMTESGWGRWLRQTADLRELRRIHLDLAVELARRCSTFPGTGGLAVLETHRHFVAAGELEKAKSFVRYGVALLVDEARRLSHSRDYGRASALYGTILAGVQEHGWPIGPKLRGYVKHYLHFNRARDQAEPLDDTEQGYLDALDDWPGNALFWSRLVRTQLYLGHPSQALTTLRRAEERVESHPLKQTFLVARTVRGLLRQEENRPERVMDAVRVWGDYEPDSEFAKDVFAKLKLRLHHGFGVCSLHLTDHPRPLFFTRNVTIQVEALSTGWLALARELDARSRGSSPAAALAALEVSIKDETRRFLTAFTHELDAANRLRKRRLLGLVDVVASGLDAEAGETTWVFGELVRMGDGLWFHTGGNLDLWFEVEPSAVPSVWRENLPYFARVRTADSGGPVGPVLELECGLSRSEDEILEEWRRRLAGE